MTEERKHGGLGGYAGKILEVDLTSRTLRDVPLDWKATALYLGGTGLATYYLRKRLGHDVGPFDSSNLLIFMTGPLAGTGVPGSGTYHVVTLGPLSNLLACSSGNGWFGARLKQAGYDGIIIQGMAAEPVYLLITDDGAALLDASDVWGMDTKKTEAYLKEKHSLPRASVAAIGPAGENKVGFAAINADGGHVASTNGGGAVMGSKLLKAVVVSGSGTVPVSDQESLAKIAKEWREKAEASPMGYTVSALGTAGFFSAAALTGWLPIKNMTTNIFPEHAKFNGDALPAAVRSTRRPCHGCPLHHCNDIEILTGRYSGLVADEPEYEGLAAFGPLIGNEDPAAAVMLNDKADRLGMDLKETGFVLALAYDLYTSGILTREDTGGLELAWGDVEVAENLMQQIARREGFGDKLAEGVYRFAQQVGPQAVDRAVYTHRGLGPHVHDPRGLWGFLFGQAISDMGSINGFSTLELIPEPDLGYAEPLPKYQDPVALVDSQVKMGEKYNFIECLGVCYFLCGVPVPLIAQAVTAVTGQELDVGSALKVGRRVITLQRQFNVEHGWTPADDTISPRLAAPCPDGPNAGIAIGPVYESMRARYYEDMGWDASGRPKPETLADLNIDA